MKRIILLIGGGSRVPAILQAIDEKKINGQIVFCVTHKKESPGLDLLKSRGVPAEFFSLKQWQEAGNSRPSYDAELAKKVIAHNPDLIVLAGWMLVLSNEFIKHFPNKIINLHPALNPSFAGAHGVEDAFNYGVKITGATVHFVPDEAVDAGPIITQGAVNVDDTDTIETLAQKVHALEDELLPRAIALFCDDKLDINGRKVHIKK